MDSYSLERKKEDSYVCYKVRKLIPMYKTFKEKNTFPFPLRGVCLKVGKIIHTNIYRLQL